MADTTDGNKKTGKVVRDLALTEIEDSGKTNVSDDEDDWGSPADIPDRPRSAQDLDDVSDIRAVDSFIASSNS